MTDAKWAVLEPLIEDLRPKGRIPPKDLRQTMSAIIWRHQNGAKWRSIPSEFGPWWRAAQLFIRWAKHGVWERLLELAQKGDVSLGMTFIDGTNIRAHHKAAGAQRRGDDPLARDNREALGARPVISHKSNEAPVACPSWIYNNRHLVENLWARLKEWRAAATRYEKTATSFLAVLCLAAAADWLKI